MGAKVKLQGAEGCLERAHEIDLFWPEWFTVSPRNCPAGVVNGRFGPDFPGTHFLGDLLQLSFASSQRDLFEDGWLEFVVRVYWLKARFLALQVGSVVGSLAPKLGEESWIYSGDYVCRCTFGSCLVQSSGGGSGMWWGSLRSQVTQDGPQFVQHISMTTDLWKGSPVHPVGLHIQDCFRFLNPLPLFS